MNAKPTPSHFASPPVLQNPTSHSITIVWAVNTQCLGWVEYGPTPDLGSKAQPSQFGLRRIENAFFHISLTGLRPGVPVYYRVAVAPITFKGGWQFDRGETETSQIYCWVPFDPTAGQASFAVINDTHEREEIIPSLMNQLAVLSADMTLWNGDILHGINDSSQIIRQILNPCGYAYATEHPVIFNMGNHDLRGPNARSISQAVIPWEKEMPTGRCFAIRHGPLAIIGLDTAEMRPDKHPGFGGTVDFESYRIAQRDWLAKAIRREEIRSAPYLVAFTHIPLWGDEGDYDGRSLEEGAQFCGQGQALWHPLLAEAGLQLLISGHRHHFRYHEPTAARYYGQIVTGGPEAPEATIVHGQADKDRLIVRVHDLSRTTIGEWTLRPRSQKN